MSDEDLAAMLRARLLGTERPVVRSGLERLWKTGRGAAGLALLVAGGRLRGRGAGLGAADVQAVSQLVSRLGELKGLAMKAGQIASPAQRVNSSANSGSFAWSQPWPSEPPLSSNTCTVATRRPSRTATGPGVGGQAVRPGSRATRSTSCRRRPRGSGRPTWSRTRCAPPSSG